MATIDPVHMQGKNYTEFPNSGGTTFGHGTMANYGAREQTMGPNPHQMFSDCSAHVAPVMEYHMQPI